VKDSGSRLPLTAASLRLRGKPGRPRTRPQASQASGTLGAPVFKRAPEDPLPGLCPRLLDLGGTAAYLGVSGWTVRDLEAAGELRRVRIPVGPGRELRKLLFDRQDLDRLLETWKDSR
jgi:hypothetical protein